MKKNNTITESLQMLLTQDEVEQVTKAFEYYVIPGKLSVYGLLQYLVAASIEQSKSFRETVNYAEQYNLTPIHYSELSTKTSEVPYGIIKELFQLLIRKCNRKTIRKLKLNKKIMAIDSATITVSKTQLKRAGFHGQRAGVKLHVQLHIGSLMPTMAEESIAINHDSPVGDKLTSPTCIIAEDRAYGKTERFDKFVSETKQSFVIRIKDNLKMVQSRKLRRLIPDDANVVDDVTCQPGTKQVRSKNRFRVITFKDNYGNEIKVCTDIMDVTAEMIAEIYKCRWTIETFFRFIKQNLNVSRIFGTTKNSVYNQLFAALIAYVLIKFLYSETSETWIYAELSIIEFLRKLRLDDLCSEVYLSIVCLLIKLR